MKKLILYLLVLGVTASICSPAVAEVGLSRCVMGNGGGGMSNGSYVIWSGTAGQAATGTMAGVLYKTESGFWCNGMSPILTGVGGPAGIPAPKYWLSQNYPNPFSRMTTLEFSIQKRGRVKITLFDVAGRKVKTILDEVMNPGHRTVSMDGAGIPNGVYFYRMESADFVKAKKLVYVR